MGQYMTVIIKIAIVLVLFTIIGSLVYSAIYLVRDKSDSRRVVRALTFRISLSVALFVLVVTLLLAGVIEPGSPFQPR